MKKKIVLLVVALVIAACGPQQVEITPHMQDSMRAYASQFESWYPTDRNIAESCMDAPGLLFTKHGMTALTCILPDPGRYGVITFDKHDNVLASFSVRAESGGQLTRVMQSAGWK